MKALTGDLLAWYSQNKMQYPWRKTTEPYRIWLSEILLQQTRIPVAIPFYNKILRRYSNLKTLAAAKDSEFLSLWSGIGYYRRAQYMLACARKIVSNHHGRFPSDFPTLLTLPGIGKYTAGAIRNICFHHLTPAIDGNVRRVLSRLFLSRSNPEALFMRLGKEAPAADFFQSLMELGQRFCLPNPLCSNCPVRTRCKAQKTGKQNLFPEKQIRKKTETFHWYLLILNSNRSYYYTRSSDRSFLKEAWLFPDILSTKRIPAGELRAKFQNKWGIRTKEMKEENILEHAITFRKIFAHILIPGSFEINGSNGKWIVQNEMDQYPTSSITAKVLRSLQVQNRQTKAPQHSLKGC